jgi:hypothetical protein
MGRCEMALDVERVSTSAWVDKNFNAEPALLKLLLRATSIVAIRNDCSTPIRNVALKVSNAQIAAVRERDSEGQIDPAQTTEATAGRLIRGSGKRQFEAPRRRLAEVPLSSTIFTTRDGERCAAVSMRNRRPCRTSDSGCGQLMRRAGLAEVWG